MQPPGHRGAGSAGTAGGRGPQQQRNCPAQAGGGPRLRLYDAAPSWPGHLRQERRGRWNPAQREQLALPPQQHRNGRGKPPSWPEGYHRAGPAGADAVRHLPALRRLHSFEESPADPGRLCRKCRKCRPKPKLYIFSFGGRLGRASIYSTGQKEIRTNPRNSA